MKHMKKLFSILCAALLCAALVSPTCAAGQLTVSAAEVSATAGSEISVPITISNNPGIALADLKITYNNDVLTFVSAENGTIFQQTELTESNASSSPYPVLLVSTSGNRTGDGTLVTLHFRISGNCQSGSFPISFQAGSMLSDFSESVLAARFYAGAVTVTAAENQIVSISHGDSGITAVVSCNNSASTVLCACFNIEGKLTGIGLKPAKAGENTYVFSLPSSSSVKVFVLDAKFLPLCASKAG